MRILNRTEIAQLQEALDTITTHDEFQEFRQLINNICDWCNTMQPHWKWETDPAAYWRLRPVVSVSHTCSTT